MGGINGGDVAETGLNGGGDGPKLGKIVGAFSKRNRSFVVAASATGGIKDDVACSRWTRVRVCRAICEDPKGGIRVAGDE